MPPGLEAMEPLRDLGGVRVIIEEIGPILEGFGLSKTKLKMIIEAGLRVNGISILPVEKSGAPAFHLLVRGVPYRKIRSIIYSVTAELRQQASLTRNPGPSFMAPTWTRGVSGVVSEGDMARGVADTVKDLMEQFIHDYRRANHPDRRR